MRQNLSFFCFWLSEPYLNTMDSGILELVLDKYCEIDIFFSAINITVKICKTSTMLYTIPTPTPTPWCYREHLGCRCRRRKVTSFNSKCDGEQQTKEKKESNCVIDCIVFLSNFCLIFTCTITQVPLRSIPCCTHFVFFFDSFKVNFFVFLTRTKKTTKPSLFRRFLFS